MAKGLKVSTPVDTYVSPFSLLLVTPKGSKRGPAFRLERSKVSPVGTGEEASWELPVEKVGHSWEGGTQLGR